MVANNSGGRGNGWVFAGLPLIVDNLPLNCSSRSYYIRLFTEMAEAVRKTQCKDGDWRTSLLDPDSYNMPENSCSAFMCFGIAWGIRNGYLPQRTYKPVLEKRLAIISKKLFILMENWDIYNLLVPHPKLPVSMQQMYMA